MIWYTSMQWFSVSSCWKVKLHLMHKAEVRIDCDAAQPHLSSETNTPGLMITKFSRSLRPQHFTQTPLLRHFKPVVV